MTLLLARPSALRPPPEALELPGDKSLSHRALIFAALAEGTSRISGLLESEDVLATAAAVRALGADVERTGPGIWEAAGRASWQSPAAPLDFANSGTGVRLVAGAVAGRPVRARFTGDASLSRRPMGRVLEPLAAMGAEVSDGEGGRLPFTLQGAAAPRPLEWRMRQASAQVKSAILLAGLNAAGETRITEPRPSRDHSERLLALFGARIKTQASPTGERVIRLKGGRPLAACDIAVPGDPSSAAFLLVAQILAGEGRLRLAEVCTNPHRTGLFATLGEMGAPLAFKDAGTLGAEPVAEAEAAPGPLRAVVVPASRAASMIDEYPILAVAAALAQGTTVLCGLDELRHKESDRFAAILNLLQAAGVRARETQRPGAGLAMEIEGTGGAPPPGGGEVDAKGDHRLAMSAAVLGLACREAMAVCGAETIATSFPDFARLLASLGGQVEERTA